MWQGENGEVTEARQKGLASGSDSAEKSGREDRGPRIGPHISVSGLEKRSPGGEVEREDKWRGLRTDGTRNGELL